jgi:C4-type Zn-finger protein
VSVNRTEQQLRCPFCGASPQAYKSKSHRRPEGGHVRTRYYSCACGATCKSVGVVRGPGRAEFTDNWISRNP